VADVVRVGETVGEEFGGLLAEIVIAIITTKLNPNVTGKCESSQPWFAGPRERDDHGAEPITVFVDRSEAKFEPSQIFPVASDKEIATQSLTPAREIFSHELDPEL
jgi:hypothetical protein